GIAVAMALKFLVEVGLTGRVISLFRNPITKTHLDGQGVYHMVAERDAVAFNVPALENVFKRVPDTATSVVMDFSAISVVDHTANSELERYTRTLEDNGIPVKLLNFPATLVRSKKETLGHKTPRSSLRLRRVGGLAAAFLIAFIGTVGS